jgi:hypothetical protein
VPDNWLVQVTTRTPSPSIVITNEDLQAVDQLTIGILSQNWLEVCEIEVYGQSRKILLQISCKSYANFHRFAGQFECGRPEIPANGRVSIVTNQNGQVATYSCKPGYMMVGTGERTCNTTQWTRTEPICIAKTPRKPTDLTVTVLIDLH